MPSPEPARSKTFRIHSRTSEVAGARESILDAVRACGYTDDDLSSLNLAIEEALVNAVRHGNGEDAAKRVTVSYAVDSRSARITIRDEGVGFDTGGLPDPTDAAQRSRPGGRGVLLMRATMDEVCFADGGREVTLVKHRSGDKTS